MFILVIGIAAPVKAAPKTSAKAYVLMEAGTGRVLASNNHEEKLPMASTTKIMTCILAIENSKLGDIVKVGKNAVGLEGTSIYLKEGETVTMEELVYGLMLASGNDAAAAIAEHISGSIPDFAKLMNTKAQEIGAVNTNFVTPNGLPDDEHYTTAYDLALISAYAMQNEQFREIVSTTKRDFPEDEDSPARYLRSRNKILYQYEGGNGIKTGYTKAAGKCLCAAAYREDMQLIAVVLNDYNMFEDCKNLMTYGFDTYNMVKVASAGEVVGEIAVKNGLKEKVEANIKEDIFLPLMPEEATMVERKVSLEDEFEAPVKEGKDAGRVDFYIDGEKYTSADIVAAADVGRNTYMHNLLKVFDDWLRISHGGENEISKIFGVSGNSIKAKGGTFNT